MHIVSMGGDLEGKPSPCRTLTPLAGQLVIPIRHAAAAFASAPLNVPGGLPFLVTTYYFCFLGG